MVKVTLDTFYQEFKDSQKYLIETLNEIKIQTQKTNGRVNKHDTEIALLQSNIVNCTEKQDNFVKSLNIKTGHRFSTIAIVVSVVAVLTNLIFHFL